MVKVNGEAVGIEWNPQDLLLLKEPEFESRSDSESEHPGLFSKCLGVVRKKCPFGLGGQRRLYRG